MKKKPIFHLDGSIHLKQKKVGKNNTANLGTKDQVTVVVVQALME